MEELNKVDAMKTKALLEIEGAKTLDELARVRNTYLTKKSELSMLMGAMKDIPVEARASYGKAVNDARNAITEAYNAKNLVLESAALNAKLKGEEIDITLPGVSHRSAAINPYYIIIDEMTEIFASMGFEIVEGRDVETDHFNFELLNVPKDHPARDMQDTFYIDDSLLLRTQTSAAQAHTMIAKGGKEPIRMICPGKCYRRDDDDMPPIRSARR